MKKLKVPTKRGVLLDGVLFGGGADTVMIAITGIHGNFYSNPFYYNIGNTLNSGESTASTFPNPPEEPLKKWGITVQSF